MPYAAQQTQFQFSFVEVVIFAFVVPLLVAFVFVAFLVLLPRAELAFLQLVLVPPELLFRQVFVFSGAEPAFLRQLRQRSGAAAEGTGLAPARESADGLCLGDPQATGLLLRQKAQLRLLPGGLTDAETGASYRKGYYDENGQRYENVAFEENGKYKSVVCGCPYCGLDTILDLGADAAAEHSLKCPNCGGPMEIRSELDTILGETPENTHVYNSEESLRNAFPQKQKKKTRLWPIVLALMLAFSAVSRLKERRSPEPVQQLPTTVSSGNTLSLAPFGDHLYLEKQEDGSYHVVTDVLRADKLLDYERDSDNYYDEASDCWLWYNREVEPAVWQYWYEGVSSDFGDWGWMEHDADGWHIEASENNWIPLPEKYDSSGLWYIG